MKKILLNSSLLVVVTLLGATGVVSMAEEVIQPEPAKKSEVNVLIKDSTDIDGEGEDKDPLDPKDPETNKNHLNLVHVPESFNFESVLKNAEYSLTDKTVNDTIKVFNNRSTREWSVKASVVGNKIQRDEDTTFDVTDFEINGVSIISGGIVAKNKTPEENTGTLKTDVNEAKITFKDTEGKLKAGDKLTGTIAYQLYNTASAE